MAHLQHAIARVRDFEKPLGFRQRGGHRLLDECIRAGRQHLAHDIEMAHGRDRDDHGVAHFEEGASIREARAPQPRAELLGALPVEIGDTREYNRTAVVARLVSLTAPSECQTIQHPTAAP